VLVIDRTFRVGENVQGTKYLRWSLASNLRSIRLKLRIVGVETMNTLRRCEKVVVPRQITAK
jgi:hypothetical protein